MTDDQRTALVAEFKTGYQIPPYISDASLSVIAKECEAWLSPLVCNANFVNDIEARGLLQARMFYRFNHRENEFFADYNGDIIHWQMQEVELGDRLE